MRALSLRAILFITGIVAIGITITVESYRNALPFLVTFELYIGVFKINLHITLILFLKGKLQLHCPTEQAIVALIR